MEQKVGNAIAFFLILLIVYAMFLSLFKLLFRDGRGLGLYGGRGNIYFYDE